MTLVPHFKSLTLRSLPYGKDLLDIRAFFEQRHEHFPRGYCSIAARVVREVTKLEVIDGMYSNRVHSWNYDPKRGLFVDLTQDQFDSSLPGVSITPISQRSLYSGTGDKAFDSLVSKLIDNGVRDFIQGFPEWRRTKGRDRSEGFLELLGSFFS
jgi:hypothetical protein